MNLDELKNKTELLKGRYHKRNNLMDRYEEMYLMRWDQKRLRDTLDNVQITISPDARNSLIGAVRLMTATDPQVSVPFDTVSAAGKEQSESVERFCRSILDGSGRAMGNPVHYDIVLSLLLYGEVVISVSKTAELLAQAQAAGDRVQVRRIERIAKRTAYLFDVLDPRTVYPERDRYGVTGVYREVETTAGQVRRMYGPVDKGSDDAVVTLCEWWDTREHVVWLAGGDALIQDEHGLPFIPIVCAAGEGSTNLFEEPEDQSQAFLYTLWQSGLWERQNLALSVMYTMIYGLGANPMYLYRRNVPDKAVEIDFSEPGGVVYLDQGEEFAPLPKAVIDPSLVQGLELSERKLAESTIYRQALGEPLGGDAPFSMVALLHQAGRLPLVMIQKKGGWALGEALEIAVQWVAEDGETAGMVYQGQAIELDPEMIPDDLAIEVQLEISLPQDQMQSVNLALAATGGETPLVSQRWAREEVLNVGASDEMTKEIWAEKYAQLQAMMYFQQQAQQAQQAQAMAQQQMMAQQGQGMGGQGMMGGGPPPAQMQGAPAPGGPEMMAGPGVPGVPGQPPGMPMQGPRPVPGQEV